MIDSCIFLYFSGLQRYKVPANQNRIIFRPWVKRQPSTSPSQNVTYFASNRPNSIVAISSTIEIMDDLEIITGEDSSYYCLECDANLMLENHFKYVTCE